MHQPKYLLEDAKHQHFSLKRPALAQSANSHYVLTCNTFNNSLRISLYIETVNPGWFLSLVCGPVFEELRYQGMMYTNGKARLQKPNN